jgi:hypothetical protein
MTEIEVIFHGVKGTMSYHYYGRPSVARIGGIFRRSSIAIGLARSSLYRRKDEYGCGLRSRRDARAVRALSPFRLCTFAMLAG